MGLFSSKGHRHIEGHKELTKHSEIISLLNGENKPSKVYFPTMAPNGKPVTVLVKPGDKVKVGTKIGERSDFYVPVYSSVSGEVLENEMIFSPAIGRPIAHIVISNDGEYAVEKSLKVVTLEDSKETIYNAIKEIGMVGMGGAGFPTYIKYTDCKDIDTVLINGVECEPYLTTDYVQCQKECANLFTGAQFLMKVSDAKEAIIAIKVKKEELRDTLNSYIKDNHIEGVRVVEVPDQYPMGWERLLIKTVLGRSYSRLPAEAHVCISNCQSVIEIAKSLVTGTVPSTRLVTVSGDGIVNPTNVLCPIGTLASEVVKACGGYVEGDINVIPGGPMCGKAVRDDKFVIGLTNGSIVVLKYVERKEEACLRCGACSGQCPMNLQPVEIKLAYERKDMARLGELHVLDCVECGLCSYTCPSKIELTETIRKAKMIYKLQGKK